MSFVETVNSTHRKPMRSGPRTHCKYACGHTVSPGTTKRGNRFDTCCRECVRSKGSKHDYHCRKRNTKSDRRSPPNSQRTKPCVEEKSAKDPYDGRTVKFKMVNGGYVGACNWYGSDKRDTVSAYLYSHTHAGCGATWKIKKQGKGYVFQIVKGHIAQVPVNAYMNVAAYFAKDTRDHNQCGRSVWCNAHQWEICATVFSITPSNGKLNQVTLKTVDCVKGQEQWTPLGYNVAVHSFYKDRDVRDATSTFVMAHSHATPTVFEFIDQ